MSPAKVLILSASYGAGHNQVARAIKKALAQANPPVEAQIMDYFQTCVSPLYSKITRFFYLESIRRFPRGYGFYYWLTGKIPADFPLMRWFNSMGAGQLLKRIEAVSPSAVLSTFPTPSGLLSILRERGQLTVPTYTVITDHTTNHQWLHKHIDHYFVSHQQVASQLVEFGLEPQRVTATGIPVRHRFADIPDKTRARQQLGLDQELPMLLVMAGAFAAPGGMEELLQVLRRHNRRLQAVIVTGHNDELQQRLERMAAGHRQLRVCGYRQDIATLMAAADLLITKAGGITTSEALAAGLPMIIYRPIPGQEEENTRFLEDCGAALRAGTSARLEQQLVRLLEHPAELAALREAAVTTGRPRAASQVAHVVVSQAQAASAG